MRSNATFEGIVVEFRAVPSTVNSGYEYLTINVSTGIANGSKRSQDRSLQTNTPQVDGGSLMEVPQNVSLEGIELTKESSRTGDDGSTWRVDEDGSIGSAVYLKEKGKKG